MPVLEVFSQFAHQVQVATMLNAADECEQHAADPQVTDHRVAAQQQPPVGQGVAASASVLTPAITAPSLPSPR